MCISSDRLLLLLNEHRQRLLCTVGRQAAALFTAGLLKFVQYAEKNPLTNAEKYVITVLSQPIHLIQVIQDCEIIGYTK